VSLLAILAHRYDDPLIIKEVEDDFAKLNQFITDHLQKVEIERLLVARTDKVNRLYMDGCFDLVHSGHFNAIRQVFNREFNYYFAA